MPSRAKDWLGQAHRDLRAAGGALAAETFEWACFIAQQAAQKAVKAMARHRGGEARGHLVCRLIERVVMEEVPAEVSSAARRLDAYYVPTRYPNGWPEGKPGDYYSRQDAEAAIDDARRIVEFCERHMA